MVSPSKLVSCLALACVFAPALRLEAAPLRVHRDLTLPAARGGTVSRGLRRATATGADVGSSNTVTADAPVGRPNEAPCVDTLFTGTIFAAYSPQTFSYSPPAGCPGPYAKIVFNGNFSVSAGIQFDRTASIQLGNVPLYFGTTAEPSPNLAPSWHVERDVTDDAALLASPQPGEADIFNIVDSTYTGIISGTAFLQFYPASNKYPAASPPDLVLPFPGVAGGPQQLSTGASVLSATYDLPTNVTSAYFDVYAQSQQTDEQYFLCAPNDVAPELYACGNGPFRETEVSIDGVPAGVAPVYPWIFTGGLDPYLWFPNPGVQTLEFKPYRVDLTPFAALFSNGKKHTVAISVDNADNYFQGFATLFAYTDRSSKRVTGGLSRDTLVANPPPTVAEHLSGDAPSIDGTIAVTDARNYTIEGYRNTPNGRVTTTLTSSVDFANLQTYSNESATTGTLAVRQATTDSTTVVTHSPNGVLVRKSYVSYPLFVSLALVLDGTGTGTQVATIDQRYIAEHERTGPGVFFRDYESNEVTPTDTLDILDDEYITGNANQKSAQTYVSEDSLGHCYAQRIEAANNVVKSVTNGRCDFSEVGKP